MITNNVSQYLSPDLGFTLGPGHELPDASIDATRLFPSTANHVADPESRTAGLGLLEKLYNVTVGVDAFNQGAPRLSAAGFSALVAQLNQLLDRLYEMHNRERLPGDFLLVDRDAGVKMGQADVQELLQSTPLNGDQQSRFLATWAMAACYEALLHNRDQFYHLAASHRHGVRHSIAVEAGAKRFVEQLDKLTKPEADALIEHCVVPEHSAWVSSAAGHYGGLARKNYRLLLEQHRLPGHPALFSPLKDKGLTLIREIQANHDGTIRSLAYGLQDTVRRGETLFLREPQWIALRAIPQDRVSSSVLAAEEAANAITNPNSIPNQERNSVNEQARSPASNPVVIGSTPAASPAQSQAISRSASHVVSQAASSALSNHSALVGFDEALTMEQMLQLQQLEIASALMNAPDSDVAALMVALGISTPQSNSPVSESARSRASFE